MGAADLTISDADLDLLDAYLLSDQSPSECMMLSDLDGFLTGIAIVWMLLYFARGGARHPVLPVALGLVIGGRSSNLVDRVRLGYVTGTRMTNLLPRNEKLRTRSMRILQAETGLSERDARATLEAAGSDLRVALVMRKTNCTRAEAEQALQAAGGVVQQAVETLNTK